MLGFILSKINLLILVVAIFAIVSFFTFSLMGIVKVYEGRLLLDQLSSKAYALVSSPAYCFSDAFDLPRSIVVGGEEFFYIIKISQQEVGVDTDEDGTSDTQVNIVIFSMIPRRDYLKFLEDIDPAERTVANQPPSVAASAFRTSSQVFLFSRPYSGQEYSVGSVLSEEIFVDPNTARVRYNSIEFRKEIRNGIESVYIYPCSSTEENCETVKNEVALAANLSGGFGC